MSQQTIAVANASELSHALATATGGETILLASGDYGKLDLKGSQYASNITLKSADANAKASFSEAYLSNASNITFDTIKFDYNRSSGEGDAASKFRVENSSDITFTRSIFEGDLASGAGTGKGLVVRGSTNVDVIDSEFYSWWKAVGFTTSDNVNLIGNNIHSIRSDGVNLGRVQNVLVEDNYIHDFGGLGSKDHRDMIQIQRSSGDGSSDVTIRNNVFDMGSGDYTQGIWAGGDKANWGDPAHWHKNITVEGNVMYNSHTNGIAIHMTDGLTISENTLVSVPRAQTGGITIPKIIVSSDSKNVTIEQNVTSTIVGENGQSDWNVQNNAFVQDSDPNAAGYYGNEFIYHATAQADGHNQFEIAVGSTADQLNAGSSLSKQSPFSYDAWVGTQTTVVPNPGASGGSGNAGSGNAGSGSTDQGNPDSSAGNTTPDKTGNGDATTGNSGSGETAPDKAEAGETVSEGTENVEAAPDSPEKVEPETDISETEVTAPDSTDDVEAVPDYAENDKGGAANGEGQPSMTFDDFVLDIAGVPTNGAVELKGDAAVVDTASGPAIHFDGHGDNAKLGRLTQFENSEQIAFNVEFTRDEADGSSQRLVWNHRKIGLTLTEDGLIAHVRNNDDPFHKGFRVDNIGLNDTETHSISMLVDQASDRLQVIVDDRVVLDETDTDFDFVGADGQEWGWDLGRGSGRYVDGAVSGFAIDDDVYFTDQPVVHDELLA